jgi:hypothetical protein
MSTSTTGARIEDFDDEAIRRVSARYAGFIESFETARAPTTG